MRPARYFSIIQLSNSRVQTGSEACNFFLVVKPEYMEYNSNRK